MAVASPDGLTCSVVVATIRDERKEMKRMEDRN